MYVCFLNYSKFKINLLLFIYKLFIVDQWLLLFTRMGKQKNDKKNFQKGVRGLGTALKVSKVNEITFNCHGHKSHSSTTVDNNNKKKKTSGKNNEFDEKIRHLLERNSKQSAPKKIVKIQAPTFVLPSQGVQKEEVLNVGSVAIDDMFIGDMRKESLTSSYNVICNDPSKITNSNTNHDNNSSSSLYVGLLPKMRTNPNIFDVLGVDDDTAARLQLPQKATFSFESNQSLLFSNSDDLSL